MSYYRKKPVVISAWPAAELIRAASRDWSSLPKEVAEAYEQGGWVFCPDCIHIPTLEGTHIANKDDMVLMGVKGEFYPCKPDIFAATYEKAEPVGEDTLLTFGQALDILKKGFKIARLGWNGKGMWLCLGKGHPALPAESFWNEHTKAFAEANGGVAPVLPYIIMKTATGEILMGWLASQTDMLAEDWVIVE